MPTPDQIKHTEFHICPTVLQKTHHRPSKFHYQQQNESTNAVGAPFEVPLHCSVPQRTPNITINLAKTGQAILQKISGEKKTVDDLVRLHYMKGRLEVIFP